MPADVDAGARVEGEQVVVQRLALDAPSADEALALRELDAGRRFDALSLRGVHGCGALRFRLCAPAEKEHRGECGEHEAAARVAGDSAHDRIPLSGAEDSPEFPAAQQA